MSFCFQNQTAKSRWVHARNVGPLECTITLIRQGLTAGKGRIEGPRLPGKKEARNEGKGQGSSGKNPGVS